MRHLPTLLVLALLVSLVGCDDKPSQQELDAQRAQSARQATAKHNAAEVYHTQIANSTVRIGEDGGEVLTLIAAFDGSAEKAKALDAQYAKLVATVQATISQHEALPAPEVTLGPELKAAGTEFLKGFQSTVTDVLGPLIVKLKLSFSDNRPAGIDDELEQLKKEWSRRYALIGPPMEKVEEAYLKANGL